MFGVLIARSNERRPQACSTHVSVFESPNGIRLNVELCNFSSGVSDR